MTVAKPTSARRVALEVPSCVGEAREAKGGAAERGVDEAVATGAAAPWKGGATEVLPETTVAAGLRVPPVLTRSISSATWSPASSAPRADTAAEAEEDEEAVVASSKRAAPFDDDAEEEEEEEMVAGDGKRVAPGP